MDQNIVHVSVTYQVWFKSPGGKGHFPEGTWYQGHGFIDQPYHSIEDAKAAVEKVIEESTRWIPPHRIVQTTSIGVVIE